jgi:hypothetical protein
MSSALGVAARVLELALAILGEVAVVEPLHRLLEPSDALEALFARKLGQRCFESLGKLALCAFTIG